MVFRIDEVMHIQQRRDGARKVRAVFHIRTAVRLFDHDLQGRRATTHHANAYDLDPQAFRFGFDGRKNAFFYVFQRDQVNIRVRKTAARFSRAAAILD